jgi:SAM-dependent methyltransferase
MPEDSELTSYDSVDIEVYLKHVERPLSWNNLYERPAMIARLPSLKGKNVLDIGCASGFYTKHALDKGAYVTAVDISKIMIDRLASSIKSPNLKLFCADIAKPMPFLNTNTYDCAICSLVLHYIKNWETLLGELYRALKKGGRVVISTHHPFDMYQYLNLPSYFDFKLVEDAWGSSEAQPFKVRYYARPLNEVLRPIIQSKLKIVSIDEPLPDEKCKELAPETYKRLMERPGFLFITLEK